MFKKYIYSYLAALGLCDVRDLLLPFDGGMQDGSASKESAWSAGDIEDMDLIPGSARSPGEGNGNPLQYSCLGNPMEREAWWATVHEVAESDTTEVTNYIYPYTDVSIWGSLLWNEVFWFFICLKLVLHTIGVN